MDFYNNQIINISYSEQFFFHQSRVFITSTDGGDHAANHVIGLLLSAATPLVYFSALHFFKT